MAPHLCRSVTWSHATGWASHVTAAGQQGRSATPAETALEQTSWAAVTCTQRALKRPDLNWHIQSQHRQTDRQTIVTLEDDTEPLSQAEIFSGRNRRTAANTPPLRGVPRDVNTRRHARLHFHFTGCVGGESPRSQDMKAKPQRGKSENGRKYVFHLNNKNTIPSLREESESCWDVSCEDVFQHVQKLHCYHQHHFIFPVKPALLVFFPTLLVVSCAFIEVIFKTKYDFQRKNNNV